jgi:hypothetical protein
MIMSKMLNDYSNQELIDALSGRDFTEKALADFEDFQIEAEYENRGLALKEMTIEDYSDEEIEKEYQSRICFDTGNLSNLVNDINAGKETYTRVLQYLERVSGKLITKQLK